MSHLSLYLLGPPHIELDGQPVKVNRRKATALLAYVAVMEGSHSRDTLATLLWPESDQSRARGGLRRALVTLRKALGDEWLEADQETLTLRRDHGFRLDVRAFREKLSACQGHAHPPGQTCPDCLPLLHEATELYRGDFLAGFTLRDCPAFDEWQFFQTQGLRDEFAGVLEGLARAHGSEGDHDLAISYARRWLDLDPLCEAAHRELMRLYADSGQRTAALRQYQECERILQEELGATPEEQTISLFDAIREGREQLKAETQPAPQRRADRYRFEHKLGEGGFGQVWLAIDTELDRPVAIKRMKVEHDLIHTGMLRGEARILARLNHPNIVQVHDAFYDEAEDTYYVVMEYVEGQSLADVIPGGKALPLDVVLDIVRDVLQALSHAHAQGVVHRDVKPSNVMIDHDAKLTDFGLANLKQHLEKGSRVFVGTPAYVAPEQIEGRPVDGRADLYSVGVMLYQMLAGGRLPLEGADEGEMLQAHLEVAPVPLTHLVPSVPPALAQVAMRLLAKEADERYLTAEAAIEALASVHAGRRLFNLPAQLTPFVGREREIIEIGDLLQRRDCRLLTLIGPGGIGKSRLAVEAAKAQQDAFPHGVVFASLSPLRSADAVITAVGRSLGVSMKIDPSASVRVGPSEVVLGSPREQVLDHLRHRTVLLILDNFEHLLAESSLSEAESVGLVTEILRVAPNAKILVTSRERLNIAAEHLYPVGGMSFPHEDATEDATRYSAVQLFVNRAGRLRPHFDLTSGDQAEVVRICRLVEGMPLGIELAAALTEVLTLSEIADEIEQDPDVLATDQRDMPERHRSLRTIFDHSWSLLTPREREIVQALSIFRGGFARQAAREVVGARIGELQSLVRKSWLRRAPEGRYEFHELLREYAAEELEVKAEVDQIRDAHSAYYCSAIAKWEGDSRGAAQMAARSRMTADIENARLAWDWAVQRGKVERLDQALDGLCRAYGWLNRGDEASAACRAAAEWLRSTAPGAETRVLARILLWQNRFRKVGFSDRLARESLALLDMPEMVGYDTRSERAQALLQLGAIASSTDREQAEPYLERSLDLFEESGNRWMAARVYQYLGQLVRGSDHKRGRILIERSLALFEELGDRRAAAGVMDDLSEVAFGQGNRGEARRWAERCLVIARETGFQWGMVWSLHKLRGLSIYMRDHDEALSLDQQISAIVEEIGDPVDVTEQKIHNGTTLALSGEFALAASTIHENITRMGRRLDDEDYRRRWYDSFYAWLGAAEAHLGRYEQARAHAELGLCAVQRTIRYSRMQWALIVLAWAMLPSKAFSEAGHWLQESLSIYPGALVCDDAGMALACLGYTERGLGWPERARAKLYEAISTAVEFEAFFPLMFALPAVSLLLTDDGQCVRAVELYSLASRYAFVANSVWFEDVAGKHIAAAAESLPPEVVAAAQERGRGRDLWETAKQLLAELENAEV